MKLLIILAGFIAATYACRDFYGTCPNYKSYCVYQNVRKICPKTCGECGVPTAVPPRTTGYKYACKDYWPHCTIAKSDKFKNCILNNFVRNVCPLTCKICIATAPPTTGPLLTQAPGSCGLRQVSSGKVIGGQDANRGDWPWQVLLQKNKHGQCGGTIINKRYIVTAAHCVIYEPFAQNYTIVAGETDRTKAEGSEATYQAEKVLVYPYYSPRKYNNDIALIKLDRNIVFGKYVQPACLPTADIAPGSQNCFITGWGKIKHPGYGHMKLQQAEMPPVRSDVCYAKNKKIIPVPITPAMVCAGEGGVNPIAGCHGDSGGPYVCEVNGQWVLHGVVSYGSTTCKSSEVYTVFARVKYFRQWLSNMMRKYGDH